MVLFIGYHIAPRRYRRSIQRRGLVVHKPANNKVPSGVYVFHPDLDNQDCIRVYWGTWALDVWDHLFNSAADVWRVAYCGPMRKDPLTANAAILPSVPVVTLVTGNDKHA